MGHLENHLIVPAPVRFIRLNNPLDLIQLELAVLFKHGFTVYRPLVDNLGIIRLPP